jgi:maleamate amidohydrolase
MLGKGDKKLNKSIQSIFEKSGCLGQLSIGESVGILVVDYQNGFTNPSISPLASECSDEVNRTAIILSKAREMDIPIFFVVIGYTNIDEAGTWIKKIPGLDTLKLGSSQTELDPRLQYQSNETLIVKKYASAFAGTPLASLLTAKKIDTLFITGTTTSGCVRASAVDAISNGIKPFVVKDAVSDRVKESHDISLIDMQAKYAELVTTEYVLKYLESIKTGEKKNETTI